MDREVPFEKDLVAPDGSEAVLQDVARRLNAALSRGDRAAARAAQKTLFDFQQVTRRRDPHQTETMMKASRNELLRVYMVHGWYAEAVAVARLAVQGLGIDRRCPNREAVTRQALARVLIEAGELEQGVAELRRSIKASRTFLARVREARRLHPTQGRAASPPRWKGEKGPARLP